MEKQLNVLGAEGWELVKISEILGKISKALCIALWRLAHMLANDPAKRMHGKPLGVASESMLRGIVSSPTA